jgi:hypothetical protein
MLKMKILTVFCILLIGIKTDAVCDLKTLIVELKQDLEDNGLLDCLRVIEPPHFVEESEDQKNRRIAAQWDTSCAFESSANWQESLRKNYGINTLVDSVGEAVKFDYPDQADMCEIVRAAMAKALPNISDPEGKKHRYDFIEKIDCAGPDGTKEGPRICAASGSSYFQADSWSIFLYPSVIKVIIILIFSSAEYPVSLSM